MPVFLKDVKRELQDDISRVGKNPDGSYKFFPPSIIGRKLKDYPQLRITKLNKNAFFKQNMVSFSALVNSEVRNAIRYRVNIQFFNVQFKDAPSKLFDQKITKGNKRKVTKYHKIMSIQRNPVKLSCQCFVKDTLIQLVDGSKVTIESLVGKDKFYVYSFDEDKKRIVAGKGYNCEMKGISQIYEVKLDNGHIVNCTKDHKFLTKSGEWIEAKDLSNNNLLECRFKELSSKEFYRVESVVKTDRFEETYCFTVEKYHNFIIDVDRDAKNPTGIVVHNCADWRFRFEWELADVDGLIGQPTPYTRLTPPPKKDGTGGFPFANSTEKLGICKHINSVLNVLSAEGFLKERVE